MDNKQFFAQLGVYVLLGGNVVGYWMFWQNGASWSNNGTQVSSPAKRNGEGGGEEQQVKIESCKPVQKATPAAPPKMILAEDPQPISLPIPLPSADSSDTTIRERLAALKLQTTIEGVTQHQGDAAQPSPWLLNMEVLGTQTQLIARLRHKSSGGAPLEFKIRCDHVEMKAPEGILQAVGKVTFVGAGLNGACDRLTLPLGAKRLVFEGHVEITQSNTVPENEGFRLHGDHIDWEKTGIVQVDVRPARFNTPSAVAPPTLDAPK